MSSLLANARRRLRSDAAAATLVTGIISMMFLCLCMGFALDLTKNAYIKNAQNSKAQESVEAAVKTVDSKGSLANFSGDPTGQVPDAVRKVVSEYKNQNSSSYKSSLVGEGVHSDETTAYSAKVCGVRDVYKWNSTKRESAKMPYMVIKLDKQRGDDNSSDSVVYTVEGDNPPQHVAGDISPGTQYHVINAEIHDASQNFMLGMFGANCQDYDSKVSAVSFASQSDVNSQ